MEEIKRCPICYSKIGAPSFINGIWSDDPILHSKGINFIWSGSNSLETSNTTFYKGFIRILKVHLKELQENRKVLEKLYLKESDRTNFTEISDDNFNQHVITYIVELRHSTEKILKAIGLKKEDYFNKLDDGKFVYIDGKRSNQKDWTDPELKENIQITSKHIEDLRHYIRGNTIEDFSISKVENFGIGADHNYHSFEGDIGNWIASVSANFGLKYIDSYRCKKVVVDRDGRIGWLPENYNLSQSLSNKVDISIEGEGEESGLELIKYLKVYAENQTYPMYVKLVPPPNGWAREGMHGLYVPTPEDYRPFHYFNNKTTSGDIVIEISGEYSDDRQCIITPNMELAFDVIDFDWKPSVSKVKINNQILVDVTKNPIIRISFGYKVNDVYYVKTFSMDDIHIGKNTYWLGNELGDDFVAKLTGFSIYIKIPEAYGYWGTRWGDYDISNSIENSYVRLSIDKLGFSFRE